MSHPDTTDGVVLAEVAVAGAYVCTRELQSTVEPQGISSSPL